MQADKAPEIYAYALTDVPGYGVHKATGKIIRGEYEINRGFIPMPPELAAMARAEAKVIREDKVRLMEKLRTIEVIQCKPEHRDDAMRQRIKDMRAKAREIHAAHRVGAESFPEPMSEEKAAYFQRIMALRDAPQVSAEQAAARRKVEHEISEVAGKSNEKVA